MSYNLPHIVRTAFGINAPIYLADVYSSNDSNGKAIYSDVNFVKQKKAEEYPITCPHKDIAMSKVN